MSETMGEKIRRFRIDRLNQIVAGETPAKTDGNAKVVLHLVPINSSFPGKNYDLRLSEKARDNCRPIKSQS